jgi:hypothetical protein
MTHPMGLTLNPTASPYPSSGHRERWPWVALAILILASLLWTGGLALSHDKALNDRLAYYLVAETLASDGGLATMAKSDPRVADTSPPYLVGERPLYPLLASWAFRLFGPSVQAANAVSALMRTLTLLPLFGLALALFDTRTAVVAGLLYTLSPPWTGLGATSMSDATFAFCVYLMLWAFVVCWRRPSRLMALLSGSAFALAVLTREEGLVLGLFLAGTLLFRRRLLDLACFLLVPMLLLGWWRIYLWQNLGSAFYTSRPLLTVSQYEFYLALSVPNLRDYLASVGGWGGAINVRLFNSIAFLRNLVADGLIVDVGQAGLFPVTFLVPLGVACVKVWRGFKAKEEQAGLTCLLTLGIVLQGAAAVAFFGLPQGTGGEIRQLIVVTPFLMMLAAAGLVQLWAWRGLARGLAVVLAIQFLAFAALYQFLLIDTLVVAPPYNSTDIQALRRLAPDLDDDAVLMSRKPTQAAYYTGRPAVVLPLAGFRDLMTYAQAHGVTHLVVAPRESRTRPGLAEGLAAFPDIRPVLTMEGIQVYEVQDYAFLDSIPDDSPLAAEIDLTEPAPPPDWATLLQRAQPSTLSQVRETWDRWWRKAP